MRLRRHLALLVAPFVLAVAACVPPGPGQLPVATSFADGLAATLAHPGANPPGANDWSCHPSSAHPNPVVLVHGTFANMTDSWQGISPTLKNNGYCVFALNYGGMFIDQLAGYGDIPTSAGELSAFVDHVLSATGASKVDLVGHSQGGMMPRYYVKNLGGAAKVRTLVGLAPSNHGTTFYGLTTLLHLFPFADDALESICAACSQQVAGSDFLNALNAGGDTVAGVNYTVITSNLDEVVTPYTSEFLSGPNVTNIVVQNGCLFDLAEHLGIIYDPRATDYILNALDPAHPRSVRCLPQVPFIG